MVIKKKFTAMTVAMIIAASLSACDSKEDTSGPAASITPASQQTPSPAQEERQPSHNEKVEAIIIQAPLSRLDLGEFPYFAMPENYRTQEQHFEWERTPFWVADGAYWIEGTVYEVAFFPELGQDFSERALREDIDFMITAVGGVKVSDVDRIRMHQALSQGITNEVQSKFRIGLGRFTAYPVSTYLLRLFDADVWIHFTAYDRGANLMMTKGPPLRTPGGRLLSGVDLRTLLDQDGWVSLDPIHFETGKSELTRQADLILDEVVELLRFNPNLELAVDGHADERGRRERNLLLSQERAEAVIAALVDRGIDIQRLHARGFGDHDPASDNTTDQGHAMNRRVSLAVIEKGDPLPAAPEGLALPNN